ncbi:MAG: sensor domain-containing protein [Gallionellaceae bacterium]
MDIHKIISLVPGIVYQFCLRSDGSTCVPYASEAIREIYRLDPEEIREDASQAFIHVHPDDLESHLASIKESARDLTPWQHEYRLKFDDGTVRWLFGNALPQREADGSTLWHGFITDITERKQAELALAESEGRFREIFDTVSDAIFIHDAETGRILDVNRRMCEMYGLTREQALACGPDDLSAGVPPYSTAEAIEKIRLAHSEGQQTFDWLARTHDGRFFWVEVSLRFASIGGEQRILAVVRDISERKHVDAELRIAAIAFESQDGIVVTNADNIILRVNRAFTGITGYTAEEAVGHTPSIFKSGRHDAAFYAAMWENILHDGSWHGEIWNRRKNGEVYPEQLTITAVKGKNGETTHYVATLRDITERKAAEDEIHNLAFYDALTKLPNRRLLNDRIGQTMAASKRSGLYGALIFLDLDNFKPLNDTYGHVVGDLLLIEVAHRLTSCVREADTVARFGGDEFVVMLSELDADNAESTAQACAVAEKIRSALAEPYVLKFQQEGNAETIVVHHCTSSVGVVLFINHEASAEDILKWADMAMYRAKEGGGNLICFFDSES